MQLAFLCLSSQYVYMTHMPHVKLIHCLGRTNFEHFFKKKLCFLHSLRGCNFVRMLVFCLLRKSLSILKTTGKHMTLQMLNRVTIKIRLHTA